MWEKKNKKTQKKRKAFAEAKTKYNNKTNKTHLKNVGNKKIVLTEWSFVSGSWLEPQASL